MIEPVNISVEREEGLRNPTASRQMIDRWRLLEEEQSYFFKGMVFDRSTMLQWMSCHLRDCEVGGGLEVDWR